MVLNLICFLLGIVITICVISRPVKIEVHYKNENIIPKNIDLPDDLDQPDMVELLKNGETEEDKVYEKMGEVMNNVTDLFSGSDRS